jgi:hypothetical protein
MFGNPFPSLDSRLLISLADMPADNFVEMIRFFTTLILNADESRKI